MDVPARPRIDTARLEAFSDGVLAIVITLMAFQIVPPKGGSLSDLHEVGPAFAAFALSFVSVGIYWNNHHHLLKATERIDAGVMWANLALLFCLTLVPPATVWLGDRFGETGPTMTYGFVGLAAALSYTALFRAILHANPDSPMIEAIGRDRKGLVSLALYTAGTAIAAVVPYAGLALYGVVSIVWFVPDRRVEQVLPDVSERPSERPDRG